MNSFNVYGQTTKTIGGNTPIWLGTVKPIPVGAICQGTCQAGMAGIYDVTTQTFAPLFDLNATGGSLLGQCNAFVYNDVRQEGEIEENVKATCALVMHHPEGLLIERVYPDITEEQIATLQAKIPGVLLVREPNQSAE